jgi:hypothetical protein
VGPVFGLQASPLTSPHPLLIWASSTNAYQYPLNGVTIIWNVQMSTHKHETLENRKRERLFKCHHHWDSSVMGVSQSKASIFFYRPL